jgi:hypothetical protein
MLDNNLELETVILETGRDYTAISDEITSTIIEAVNAATDFESFEKELDRLASAWAPDRIALKIASAACHAQLRGAGL